MSKYVYTVTRYTHIGDADIQGAKASALTTETSKAHVLASDLPSVVKWLVDRAAADPKLLAGLLELRIRRESAPVAGEIP